MIVISADDGSLAMRRSSVGSPLFSQASLPLFVLVLALGCRSEGGEKTVADAAATGEEPLVEEALHSRAVEEEALEEDSEDGAEDDLIEVSEASPQDSDPLDPTKFAGFSADESRFAYAAYSRGAGVHLFTVIEAATGERVTDLPLYEEEARMVARRLLEEGGYSPVSADGATVLRGGETLRLETEPGDVRVSLVRGEEAVRLEPPKALAAVASRLRRPEAHLWGFSPKGNYVAVRITDDHGPVLGEATTYQVLSVEQARRASR